MSSAIYLYNYGRTRIASANSCIFEVLVCFLVVLNLAVSTLLFYFRKSGQV